MMIKSANWTSYQFKSLGFRPVKNWSQQSGFLLYLTFWTMYTTILKKFKGAADVNLDSPFLLMSAYSRSLAEVSWAKNTPERNSGFAKARGKWRPLWMGSAIEGLWIFGFYTPFLYEKGFIANCSGDINWLLNDLAVLEGKTFFIGQNVGHQHSPTFLKCNSCVLMENLHHCIIFNDAIFLFLFLHHSLPCKIQSLLNCSIFFTMKYYHCNALSTEKVELMKTNRIWSDLRCSENQKEHAWHLFLRYSWKEKKKCRKGLQWNLNLWLLRLQCNSEVAKVVGSNFIEDWIFQTVFHQLLLKINPFNKNQLFTAESLVVMLFWITGQAKIYRPTYDWEMRFSLSYCTWMVAAHWNWRASYLIDTPVRMICIVKSS